MRQNRLHDPVFERTLIFGAFREAPECETAPLAQELTLKAGKARTFSAQTHLVSQARALVTNMIETSPTAQFIVKDDLTLVWANQAGRARLASGLDVGLVDTYFTARSAALLEAITKTCFRTISHEVAATVRLNAERVLVISSQCLDRDAETPTTFLLKFKDVEAASQIRIANLCQSHGLTRQEQIVLEHSFNGLMPAEIAKAMGVKMPTTRTHMRNIYMKLGVSSKEALFSAVAAFIY